MNVIVDRDAKGFLVCETGVRYRIVEGPDKIGGYYININGKKAYWNLCESAAMYKLFEICTAIQKGGS